MAATKQSKSKDKIKKADLSKPKQKNAKKPFGKSGISRKKLSAEDKKKSDSLLAIRREVYAVLWYVLALFSFATYKFPDTTGVFGDWFSTGVIAFVGHQGFIYLPLFLMLPGFSFLLTHMKPRVILGASTFSFLCFVVLLQTLTGTIPTTLVWPPDFTVGGIVGSIGTFALHKAIGSYGTYLLISAVFLMSAILIFGVSLKKTAYVMVMGLRKLPLFNRLPDKKAKAKKSTVKSKLLQLLFYSKVSEDLENAELIRRTEHTSDTSLDMQQSFSMEDILDPVEPQHIAVEKPEPVYNDATPDEVVSEEAEPEPEAVVKPLPKRVPKPKKTGNFQLPTMTLLKAGQKSMFSSKVQAKQRQERAAILEEALESFNVKARVVNITAGPTVTRYELEPGEGVKISKITALSKDISLKLASANIRIEAPIPGKALVGIEVPNVAVDTITLRSIMESTDFFSHPSYLTAVMGLTITGEAIVMDLAKMPHILIAGATGSGKSVCINAIILSILMKSTPEEVKFLMIDPKKVELNLYEGIPHLLAPVVTDPHKAAATLKKWALVEMEQRYELFAASGVKDLKGYNAYVEEELKKEPESEDEIRPTKLPNIVVIIDELADLMMVASQDVEQTICRLAQMSRATGIHLVIATQRPSVNVVTGLIKANVPSRISFFLQSQIDSRTILDMAGAEKLLGKGDMLYSPVGSFKPKRVQGVFVSEEEVKAVVKWLKSQGGPEYVEEIIEVEPLEEASSSNSKTTEDGSDELFEKAKELVMSTQYASTSYLQRKLRIGYNRAARIMDELEEKGVISEYVGEKKSRSVL